jgi:phage baseplate assembly protein W
MPTYIGFSTINSNKPKTTNSIGGIDGGVGSDIKSIVYGKKFRMIDEQLVIQDLINALNIPLGQKVGQPGYGTTLWSFIFQPNNDETQRQIESEIRRIASLDPRIEINYITTYPDDNGILVEVEMAVTPYNQPLVLNVFFNQQTNAATLFS